MTPNQKRDMQLIELQTTLTIYQLVALFQAKNLEGVAGQSVVVITSHSLSLDIGHHLRETSCSEVDWLQRAQARALERLGLVIPDLDQERWTLTKKGNRAVQLYLELVKSQLSDQ